MECDGIDLPLVLVGGKGVGDALVLVWCKGIGTLMLVWRAGGGAILAQGPPSCFPQNYEMDVPFGPTQFCLQPNRECTLNGWSNVLAHTSHAHGEGRCIADNNAQCLRTWACSVISAMFSTQPVCRVDAFAADGVWAFWLSRQRRVASGCRQHARVHRRRPLAVRYAV